MRAEEMFGNTDLPKDKIAALISHARSFLTADEFKPVWNVLEVEALRPFFTDVYSRVFFVHSLPESVTDVLLAMYSRIKNERGLRGVFVDSFLPHFLASQLTEVSEGFGGKTEAFLKHYQISSLSSFVGHSQETKNLFREFTDSFRIDPDYVRKFADSPRVKIFLSTWLDKYGHNSIARMAKLTLCVENVSILAAKSLEWNRPGSGYIELSTRYVDMSGKGFYPAHKEIAEFGVSEGKILDVINQSFESYANLQGENFNGPLPQFFRECYGKLFSEQKDLESGVIGETCDVLGNFLPCATLTSLGIAVSGESFPQLLKHLILDGTPENLVLAEMITEEGKKLGYDQFSRYFKPTEWEKINWEYLGTDFFGEYVFSRHCPSTILGASLVSKDDAERILLYSFRKQHRFSNLYYVDVVNFRDIIKKLQSVKRSEFDKLPNHFESIAASFFGMMSFRSWRDLQRQQLATHYRTYVTPRLGFYRYEKPTPLFLLSACDEIQRKNSKLYDTMELAGVSPVLMQYPMALGNLVGFQIGGNLLEIEFCNWQRTKFSVNHEVRQIFLKIDEMLRLEYPWWEDISRTDITLAYVFARTAKGISLV